MIEKEYEKAIKTVALNAKYFRTMRGLTQEQMTDFGFDYRYYQRIESGKHSMSLYTIVKLASAFKVPLVEMFKPHKN